MPTAKVKKVPPVAGAGKRRRSADQLRPSELARLHRLAYQETVRADRDRREALRREAERRVAGLELVAR